MTDQDLRNWNEIILKLRSRTSHQVFNERAAVEMERLIRALSNAETEAEANRKDAERYRFCRQYLITGEHLPNGKLAFFGDGDGLDDIIDAALRGKG